MCGRFAMPWDPDELADRLGVNTNEDARSVAPVSYTHLTLPTT